jgi:protein-tyrosine phosphatase
MSSNIKMYRYIKLVLPIIDSYVKNKKPVFINCMAGMQRSAAIAAAYLIVYRGYNVEEAITYIRKKRPIAFRPGPNFLHTLNMVYYSQH